jgi:predicted O-methyltransferase YrrM
MTTLTPSLARQRALDAAHGTSLPILRAMPHLVAVRRPDGGAGDAVMYQDEELRGALCATAEEAQLLAYVAQTTGAHRALEIGSYVGWTAAHLAQVCDHVVCIDPFLELGGVSHLGDEPNIAVRNRFLANVRAAKVEGRITLIQGESPEVLWDVYVPGGFDLAFVDGWHLDGQPLRDVEMVALKMKPLGTIVLHDLHVPDVQEAARYLLDMGYAGVILPTPNWLGVFWVVAHHTIKPPGWLWTLPAVRRLCTPVPGMDAASLLFRARPALLELVAGRE